MIAPDYQNNQISEIFKPEEKCLEGKRLKKPASLKKQLDVFRGTLFQIFICNMTVV